jgi:hypothetical protein
MFFYAWLFPAFVDVGHATVGQFAAELLLTALAVGVPKLPYGNNYAGANLGNLDVFLASLQKYAPLARVIVMVDKHELQHAERLADRYPLRAVLVQPVTAADMEMWLPA